MDVYANTRRPLLCADCVIFLHGGVVFIHRKYPPFEGFLALPGGMVEWGETVEAACKREVKEETGLDVSDIELVGVYSKLGRDPRGHTVTVVYMTKLSEGEPMAGSDASDVVVVTDWQKEKLAFDHQEVMEDAVRVLRNGKSVV